MKAISMQNLTIMFMSLTFMSKKDAYGLVKNAVIMGEKGTL